MAQIQKRKKVIKTYDRKDGSFSIQFPYHHFTFATELMPHSSIKSREYVGNSNT